MIIKGLCNGIPVTVERCPSLVGFERTTAMIRGPAPNLPCSYDMKAATKNKA